MANYEVRFLKTEENLAKERERWSSASPFSSTYIGLDFLIDVILHAERDGVMLRDRLEYYDRVKNVDFSAKLGRESWKYIQEVSNKKNNFHYHLEGNGNELRNAVPTETLHSEIGKIFLKCYRVAKKFNVLNSKRCDDRFRYWCIFNMDESNFLMFEDIVMERLFYKNQREFALKYGMGRNNFTRLIAKWDEYVDFEDLLDKFFALNMFSREEHKEEQIEFRKKLVKLNKYLEEVSDLAKNKVMEIFTDFDGIKRRKQISINSELYVEKLRQVKPLMEKLARFYKFSLDICKVQFFVDSEIISWDLLGTVNYFVEQILKSYQWFVDETLKFDMNSRNFIKSDRLSDELQGLQSAWDNLNSNCTYIQKYWEENRTEMAFGLTNTERGYMRYIGGKPRRGEIRKRIFS